MPDIFRILNLDKNGVTDIYIFKYTDEIQDYKKDITDNIEDYKQDIGMENYREIEITGKAKYRVYMINDYILIDDNIDTIKRKILKATENTFSFEEIYLFGLIKKEFLNDSIFEQLSQNSKLEITQTRLIDYILNFSDINIEKLNLEKETYNYNDIIGLNIHQHEKVIKIPIGQKFYGEASYPVATNPFDTITYDNLLVNNSDNLISTQNKLLLLDYPNLYEKNIYLSTVDKVIDYMKDYDLSIESTIKIYFSLLLDNEINNEASWREKRSQLIKENEAKITKSFNKRNQQVILLNTINEKLYNEGKDTTKRYIEKGVKIIRCTLHQNNKLLMPLEILFKLIRTNKEIPFVKYNPGMGREKIYRIYSNKTAINGKKIPYLNKATIIRMRNTIAKQKSVACYINGSYGENKYNIPMIITLFENLDIQIETETKTLLSIDILEGLFKEYTDKLMTDIQLYLIEHGYTIDLFNGFNRENISIDSMDYVYKLPIKRNIDVNKYKCFSALFNVIEGNLKKNIQMRYKRVSYFNKMDSIEAYITELINMGVKKTELIDQLKVNFDLSNDEALNKYANWMRNIQVEQQLYENRKLKIKSNPGFPVTIIKEKFNNNIIITVGSINNVKYVDVITIYINVLIEMTQDIKGIPVKSSLINKLCNSSLKEDEDDITPDRDSKISLALERQEDFILNDTGISYDDEGLDDEYGLIGLLEEGSDEEDDDDDTGNQAKGYSDDSDSDSNIELESSDEEGEEFELELSEGEELLDEDEEDEEERETISLQKSKTKTPSKTGTKTQSNKALEEENEGSDGSEESDEFDLELEEGEELLDKEEEQDDDDLISATKSKSKSKTKTKTKTQSKKSLDEESGIETNDEFELELEEGEELLDKEDDQEDELISASKSKTKSKTKTQSKKSLDDESESGIESNDEFELSLDEGSILSSVGDNETPKSISKIVQQTQDKPMDKVREEEDLLEEEVAGMPLSNPNYFFQRMRNRDKKLFLTNKDGKFNAYSRICPHNVRRQPVILTDKEKEKIDKNNPGSYDHAIKYGSSKDKQHWYICPRYWCLKTNTSMTEEQVKAGECGGSTKIIPRTARKVPKDAFVFEFNADSEHKDGKGEYIKHYPGFVKSGSHPDDLCLPCCFKSWDSKAQKERRDICLENKVVEKKPIDEHGDYIKTSEKYPLEKGRWGYLPINMQKILHTNNEKCKDPIKNTLKPFKYCILRKGVEVNKTQSFIGVIADLYVEVLNEKNKDKGKKRSHRTPNITVMKNILLDAIDIDTFISYFNGSLIEMFQKDSLTSNIELYRETNIYDKIMNGKENYELTERTNRKNVDILRDIVSSYENFKDYILDDNVIIDHTFLWDIISKPNKKLFKTGLNLAIFEITDNDVTDNIELLCPTNNYSNEVFSSKKLTVIILKREGFYEPIYVYRDEQKSQPVVNKFYSNYNSHLLSNIKEILELVKKTYSKCVPLPSMPKTYKFQKNIDLVGTTLILKKYNIDIVHQIINYNNNVIGVIVETEDGYYRYLPIQQSSIQPGIDYSYSSNEEITITKMTDERSGETKISTTIKLWTNLLETVEYLRYLKKLTKNKLLCNPIFKVVEDGLVVGIITETNQFLQLREPEENIIYDELETIDGYNYMDIDESLLLDNRDDKKRIEMVNIIRLENNFYNAFRSTVKQIINKYEHLEFKKELEFLSKDLIPYHKKIEQIQTMIRNFMRPYIDFTQYNKDTLNAINKLTSCVSSRECGEKQYCLETRPNTGIDVQDKEDKICKLLIPDKHLLSGNNNEDIYYYRMADEIIRYGKINNYIFKPKVYLSFDKIDYNLSPDEIILLDTLLMEGYFDDLKEAYNNKYISHTASEFIQPSITQTYDNKYNYKDLMKPIMDDKCISRVIDKIRGNWRAFFSPSFKELEYENTTLCSFNMMYNIIKDHTNNEKEITINDIKNVLVDSYKDLIETYGVDRIIRRIIKEQGKEKIARQILEGNVTIEEAIISDNYYITNLDILLLSSYYKLPVIIIAGTELYELKKWMVQVRGKFIRKMWVSDDAKDNEYYYIIKQPGIKRNIIPKYSIIFEDKLIRTPKDKLSKKFSTNIKIYKNRPSFDDYITSYTRIFNRSDKKPKLKLVTKK